MGDKLLKHGGIIFSALIISFFFAYVFQFYMARALGPESYGILGSMLSLLYIFSVPSSVITTTLAQIVAEKGKEEHGKIKSILLVSAKKLVYIGLITFAILTAVSPLIKDMLNLPSVVPVVLLGFSLIFITILPSPRGVLQGMQEFTNLGLNMVIDKPALLLFGAIFIYLGMGVNGAILSYGTSALAVLILAFIPLKSTLANHGEQVSLSVYKYASPIFILILGITVMSSIDILFVRRYFSAEVSGYFAAMKMMGEVIYFSAFALGGVLLPKVSELKMLNSSHGFLLRKALTYFGVVLAGVLSAYALAPEFIITLLFGKGYSSISGYLVWYTLAMGILSLAVIFMFYDISVKRTAFRYPLVVFTAMQVVLLAMFHESIGQIIGVQIATFMVLLVSVMRVKRGMRAMLEKVKDLVDRLKNKLSIRQWGYYTVLENGPMYKVKRLCVLPGKSMSHQMHYHRAEHWIVVKGTAKIVNDGKEAILHENESVYVPKSVPHRIENPGKMELHIIEVQTGEYLEEDDIVRFDG